MAMKPSQDDDGRVPGAAREPDAAIVDEAAAALRSYADRAWAGASRRILDHVLTATRRSRPVRAASPDGTVHVSDQVVTMHLADAVDDLPDVRLTRARLDLRDDLLVAITVGVSVRYPERIHPLADEVRRRVVARVQEVLGPVRPPVTTADVAVEVDDVTPP